MLDCCCHRGLCSSTCCSSKTFPNCPPLSVFQSRRPMRCRLLSPGTDVVLREVTMFSMMCTRSCCCKCLLDVVTDVLAVSLGRKNLAFKGPAAVSMSSTEVEDARGPMSHVVSFKGPAAVSMSSTEVEDGRGPMSHVVLMIRRCCSGDKLSMSTSP